MQELKQNDIVNLTNGSTAKVIKELGRGGQGIVYLVDLAGQKMALKWYKTAPDSRFYKNLEDNILKGAPSDAFLWPEYLTKKERGSYGYIMKLRPAEYHEFGNYLLARVRFGSIEAMLNAAMKICDGFRNLHRCGYSYQDLNDGNFFIHPATGDVLICDNDNVMPEGEKSGILGKARYMAPEIMTGQSAPNKYSDRFSLSVILFMLFYGNHPLEGSRVLACPCMTEAYEKKFFGSDAVFIYDEQNTTNRPVRGVHNNVLKRWPVFPQLLRDTFKTEFGEECLKTPSKRLLDSLWQKIIQQLRDMLVVCPECGDETFIEDINAPKCINCGKAPHIAGALQVENRNILLTPKTRVYCDMNTTADMLVVSVPGDKFPVQLMNTTSVGWTVETPSGKLRQIPPKAAMPIKAGLNLSYGKWNGEIIEY